MRPLSRALLLKGLRRNPTPNRKRSSAPLQQTGAAPAFTKPELALKNLDINRQASVTGMVFYLTITVKHFESRHVTAEFINHLHISSAVKNKHALVSAVKASRLRGDLQTVKTRRVYTETIKRQTEKNLRYVQLFLIVKPAATVLDEVE
ncbi:hypothetical protein F2P81_012039 [Scophthalmus maximus]|uniref:Uncharacterized protein n=1 Tax=Scophthalmus maximus TaxID=52904 RepID=A0A6A4STG3_SCOMX|nr:hypothetical protein F2P81_012039 [Scophthalmus maximus]